MRKTVKAEREDCTGCGACVTLCPKGAIAMRPDEEGFLYPVVDSALCVECGLCEACCPAGQTVPDGEPLILGAQHRDEDVRRASSSGGVFTALAERTLAHGGVVFGAAFASFHETMHVEHVGAFDQAELSGMRGSKYVQSDATDAIAHALQLLERGIPVLFSGTPCQISGLLACVKEETRELLLTVDFVCHGVPSPGVFAAYIRELEEKHGSRVRSYSFRDKRLGWKNFSATAVFEDGTEYSGTQQEEPFLRGFLQNLYLRPSCERCDILRGKRHLADITIADLWGAQEVCPDRDDDTGLSLVLANTKRGRDALAAARDDLITFPMETERLLRYNPCIEQPVAAHRNRAKFFAQYAKHGFESAFVMKLLAPPSRLERLAARLGKH